MQYFEAAQNHYKDNNVNYIIGLAIQIIEQFEKVGQLYERKSFSE